LVAMNERAGRPGTPVISSKRIKDFQERVAPFAARIGSVSRCVTKNTPAARDRSRSNRRFRSKTGFCDDTSPTMRRCELRDHPLPTCGADAFIEMLAFAQRHWAPFRMRKMPSSANPNLRPGPLSSTWILRTLVFEQHRGRKNIASGPAELARASKRAAPIIAGRARPRPDFSCAKILFRPPRWSLFQIGSVPRAHFRRASELGRKMRGQFSEFGARRSRRLPSELASTKYSCARIIHQLWYLRNNTHSRQWIWARLRRRWLLTAPEHPKVDPVRSEQRASAKRQAALRCAEMAWSFVAQSVDIAADYTPPSRPRSRPIWAQRMHSYFGDTTLESTASDRAARDQEPTQPSRGGEPDSGSAPAVPLLGSRWGG